MEVREDQETGVRGLMKSMCTSKRRKKDEGQEGKGEKQQEGQESKQTVYSHSVQVRAKKVLAAESESESLTEWVRGRLIQGAQHVTRQLTTLVTTVKAMMICDMHTHRYTHTDVIINI